MNKLILIYTAKFNSYAQSSLVLFGRLLKIFITFLFSIACCLQIAYAGSDITITKAKKNEVKVYAAPKSSALIKGESISSEKIKGIPVKKEAMSGRFLQISIDNKEHWIKARQVITTKTYDVGACEVQNKATGTRAAVNCTE